MFGGGNNLQDQMLKAYVDTVFNKYDTDRSGSLDQKQMTTFFNELFSQLNINRKVSASQSLEAIKSIDKNFDGNVNKAELFLAFKAMLMKSQQQAVQPPQPQPQGYYNQPMYGSYHPPQGGYYGGYPPPPQGYYGGYAPPPQPGYPYYPQMHQSQPMYGQQQPYGMNPGYGNQMYGSNQMQNPYQPQNPNTNTNQMYNSQGQNQNKNQNQTGK